ncbi:MAG: hypothetical protein WCT12_04285 [Verrucomicrobiota bacterium]
MRKILFMVAFLAIVSLWGCQHGAPYDPLTRPDGRQPHQVTHGVSMLDKNVRDAFLLDKCVAQRLPLGQIQVQITLQNRFDRDDLWVETQFVFFDDNQLPVEKSEWQTVHFPPLDVVLIKGSSLRTDARSFNVQFRHLKSKTGRRLPSTGCVFEGGVWIKSILPN